MRRYALLLVPLLCSSCMANHMEVVGSYASLTAASVTALKPAFSLADSVCNHQGDVEIALSALEGQPAVDREAWAVRCQQHNAAHVVHYQSLALLSGYAHALQSAAKRISYDRELFASIAQNIATTSTMLSSDEAVPEDVKQAAGSISKPASQLAAMHAKGWTERFELPPEIRAAHEPVMALLSGLRTYDAGLDPSLARLRNSNRELEFKALKQLEGEPVAILNTVNRFSSREIRQKEWETRRSNYLHTVDLLSEAQSNLAALVDRPDDDVALEAFEATLSELKQILD